MQMNTLTNEAMRNIIQALSTSHPAAAQPMIEHNQIQPLIPAYEKPPYKPNIKIKVSASPRAFPIAFSDISFISTEVSKITLPYSGTLPNELLLYILNSTLENCFTIRELMELQKRGAWALDDIVINLAPSIRIKPSRLNPMLALQFNVEAINGRTAHETLMAEVKPRHIVDMLNRFFNRKNTGLKADVCASLERQHVEYKRRHLPL